MKPWDVTYIHDNKYYKITVMADSFNKAVVTAHYEAIEVIDVIEAVKPVHIDTGIEPAVHDESYD